MAILILLQLTNNVDPNGHAQMVLLVVLRVMHTSVPAILSVTLLCLLYLLLVRDITHVAEGVVEAAVEAAVEAVATLPVLMVCVCRIMSVVQDNTQFLILVQAHAYNAPQAVVSVTIPVDN